MKPQNFTINTIVNLELFLVMFAVEKRREFGGGSKEEGKGGGVGKRLKKRWSVQLEKKKAGGGEKGEKGG